ncbi:hypothetical protein [Marinobacter alexandrii]|uniref:hypothetical protein n=1 Tax=Marinobacter alexandrii TaxID=2570351 RepID=UPI00326569D7
MESPFYLSIISLGISLFALLASFWRLNLARTQHKWKMEERERERAEKDPVYDLELNRQEFNGRGFPFKMRFRQVTGESSYIQNARVHFQFYRYLDDDSFDEVWNVWVDLVEKKWVKPEDEYSEIDYFLDLSQLFLPTAVNIRLYVDYDDKWRYHRDLDKVYIKPYIQEILGGNAPHAANNS